VVHTEKQKSQVKAEEQGAEQSEQQTAQPERQFGGKEEGPEILATPGEEELRRELDETRREIEEHRDRTLRLAAEFENYKKRMERERATMLKYAEEQILRELLTGMDNLERALEQGRTTDNIQGLLAGVEMTHLGLREILKKFGVTPVESAGKPFDPNIHEAVAMEASCDATANTVLTEYQKGYLYKDRLLRPAKVIVCNGPPRER